ncbi:hypothetical protein [Streptomyces sp. NPDC004658]|uniref:hypothetical protein n=1 Tax=Streptomyces sp. NPDC004658 TaxID=3154672 RepID=UPI0033AA0AEE
MPKIEVSRGNCPCLRKDPRELAADGQAPRCPGGNCGPEEIWGAMPDPAIRHLAEASSDEYAELRISGLRGLVDGDFGDQVVLVCAPAVRARLKLSRDVPTPVHELVWSGPDSRADLLEVLREARRAGLRTTVLWIADDEFEHLLPEDIQDTKLGAISFFSTGFSVGSLARHLEIICATDYRNELEIEERLINSLEEAGSLLLLNSDFGTSCRFHHQESPHWFSLHGPLRWGDQTVLPTGELSTLADDAGEFDTDSRVRVNGDIVLKGSPIIHRGEVGVTREDTAQTYARLAGMEDAPVIARVSGGWIQEFVAPTAASRRVRDAFTALVEAEPRYRKIHEFGFGTHPLCADRVRANFHPNERQPGIHLGLGLGHYTPFHIDLALTGVQVLLEASSGEPEPLYPSLGLTAS